MAECLDSILNNTSYPNFTPLVVDNGSTDGSYKEAERREEVQLKKLDRNLGFDIANNKAIYDNPEYDHYLLLNNDTEVKEGWLSSLVESSEEKDAGLVGPKILYPDHTIQSAGFINPGNKNIREGLNSEEFNEIEEVDAIHGAAMMIRRDAVEKIGYLDEIFSLVNAEEWDYCSRTKEAGIRICVDGKSEIIHKEDKTKDNMGSELVYFLSTKNSPKESIMNRSMRDVGSEFYTLLKKLGAGVLGYRFNPPRMVLRSFKEILVDLPVLISKRRNPDRYVPSYYCENIKDYSKRYVDLKD